MNPASLHVVGLGPGDAACLTPQASTAIANASCVAGYSLYMELVPPELLAGKQCISTGMRHEEERCAAAVDAALSGQPTALVCSGDPGIYALAGLALEILENRNLVGSVPFSVVPGVPAVCAAAALLGAPLMHDFACISLSDLLTPWETIERRLHAALEADFVCVIYNPRSKGRPGHLDAALALARRFREPQCPVGLVRQAYRPEQSVSVHRLDSFDAAQVDMLSLLIIGNSESRSIESYMLTPRGYARKRQPKADK